MTVPSSLVPGPTPYVSACFIAVCSADRIEREDKLSATLSRLSLVNELGCVVSGARTRSPPTLPSSAMNRKLRSDVILSTASNMLDVHSLNIINNSPSYARAVT